MLLLSTAQQVVEKLLKFILQEHKIEFLWTHDIYDLLQQMETNNLDFPEWLGPLADLLTSYAVKTRYHNTLVASKRGF